jgi:hypothetical protein
MKNSVNLDLFCDDCEVLLDSGCLRCDLFLPAHDIIKLGLIPLQTVVKSQPIRGPSFFTRQFGSVFVQFKFKDQDGNEVLRGCDLEAWCSDEEYNHLISTRRNDAASSAPSSSSPTDCSTGKQSVCCIHGSILSPD